MPSSADPHRTPLSSGDLLLDRRFDYAAACSSAGEHAAAAELLTEIVALAPHWVPGWIALGDAAERNGDRVAAETAFREAAARDSDGRFGAALHLGRLAGHPATAMPSAYVAALFDDYAPRFDRHLVEALGYSAPATIVAALDVAGAPTRIGHVLDLGCGTGLMGRAIRHRAGRLDGVDLSRGMIEGARRTGVYDTLAVTTLEAALAGCAPGSLDLVVAADVFVYCGPLAPICAAAAAALRPGGLLAFTVQSGAGDAVRLGDDMRFSHSEAHVRAAVVGAGLAVAHLAAVSTRRDAGQPVPGLVVVARQH